MKLLIDPMSGSILDANRAACRFYKRQKDAFVSMNLADLGTLAWLEVLSALEAAPAEESASFKHTISPGDVRTVEAYPCPVNLQDRKLLCVMLRDVTERSRAQRMLHRWERVFLNAGWGIVIAH
jgi:hypothetical protein